MRMLLTDAKMQTPMPESVKDMIVYDINEVEKVAEQVDLYSVRLICLRMKSVL